MAVEITLVESHAKTVQGAGLATTATYHVTITATLVHGTSKHCITNHNILFFKIVYEKIMIK